MTIQGIYVNLSMAQLQSDYADAIALKQDITRAHQGYGIAGRNISRAQLATVMNDIAELSYAIKWQGGQIIRVAVPDMSTPQ